MSELLLVADLDVTAQQGIIELWKGKFFHSSNCSTWLKLRMSQISISHCIIKMFILKYHR